MSKQSLKKEDWDTLIPGKVHTIGSTQFIIKPLGLSKLADTIRKMNDISVDFTEKGITPENFDSATKLLDVAHILVQKAPEIIAEAANIELEDIMEFPFDIIVDLVRVLIEVNLEAKDKLSKNLDTLGNQIAGLLTGVMAISPSSSSPRGIRGKVSRNTISGK